MALPDRIPALTIRQPWEFAIEHGKPVENRSWEVKYRGPLWLHAGARSRWDTAGAEFPLLRQAWAAHVRSIPDWAGLPSSDVELGRRTTLMPFGAVAALTEVTGCHHARMCWQWDGERSKVLRCSPWAMVDQWHIELTDVRPLPEPVPCRGALGLWKLPEDVEKAVRVQLEATDGS